MSIPASTVLRLIAQSAMKRGYPLESIRNASILARIDSKSKCSTLVFDSIDGMRVILSLYVNGYFGKSDKPTVVVKASSIEANQAKFQERLGKLRKYGIDCIQLDDKDWNL